MKLGRFARLVMAVGFLGGGCGSSTQMSGRGGTGGQCDGGPPASLGCSADRCGMSLKPECSLGRWGCPVIQTASSCRSDGDVAPTGVVCGSGTCQPGMVCEIQSEEPPTWACAPFPPSCPTDAGWLVTCGCLLGQTQYLCPAGSSAACEPLDGGFAIPACPLSSIRP